MASILIRFCVLLLLAQQTISAQHTFEGTFSPAKDYRWALLYNQKTDGQLAFIAEGSISSGKAEISMPKDAPVGTYRVVYGIPEDKNYFEILYNGKENISCSFSPKGLLFTESNENKMIGDYFSEMYTLENNLINFYKSGSTNSSQLKDLTLKLKEAQIKYEKESEGLMANNFIKSNHPYIPASDENALSYIVNAKDHYFDYLDLNNPIIQGSNFLNDKLFNYVFTSLPPKRLSQEQVEKVRKENVTVLNGHMNNVDEDFKLFFFYVLWKKASDNALNSLADYIYTKYLKVLAVAQKKEGLVDLVEQYNILRIGATAPAIVGDEKSKNLADLSGADRYVLVFWSSHCPHCLEQIPVLHESLSNETNVKVFAVGLEPNSETWKKEVTKLKGFEHSLAIGELQSKTAVTYQVKRTPTYFILDAEKKILFKPQNLEEVLDYLKVN